MMNVNAQGIAIAPVNETKTFSQLTILPLPPEPIPPQQPAAIHVSPSLYPQPILQNPTPIISQNQLIYHNPSLSQINLQNAPLAQPTSHPVIQPFMQPVAHHTLLTQPAVQSAPTVPSVQGEREYLFTCTCSVNNCHGDHTYSDKSGTLVYKYNYHRANRWLEGGSGQQIVTIQSRYRSNQSLNIVTSAGIVNCQYSKHMRQPGTLTLEGKILQQSNHKQQLLQHTWTDVTTGQLVMALSNSSNMHVYPCCSEAMEKAIAFVHAFQCHMRDIYIKSN